MRRRWLGVPFPEFVRWSRALDRICGSRSGSLSGRDGESCCQTAAFEGERAERQVLKVIAIEGSQCVLNALLTSGHYRVTGAAMTVSGAAVLIVRSVVDA